MTLEEMTMENLEGIVPDRIFWRGEDLYIEGAVQDVKIAGALINATVVGGRHYKVRADALDGDIFFSCNCPYEGFCKHSIALGLWIVNHKKELKSFAKKVKDSKTNNVDELLEQASGDQKDKFLKEALVEFPVLLNRFEIMMQGAANVGLDISVDELGKEIKSKLENFDLEDYSRFYDTAPERYGYREEWEVLQDGAEEEIDALLEPYKNKALDLLKIRNVIGAFRYLLSIYEALKDANFNEIEDPASIFEGDGLEYLSNIHLDLLLNEFLSVFVETTFEENVYMQLIDLFFDRIEKTAKNKIYQIDDFNDILVECLFSKKIALRVEELLQKHTILDEKDYCKLLMAIYMKTEAYQKWMTIANKYFKTDQDVAEKLLNHSVNQKAKLVDLAREIAFLFNNKFIPFFYENLNKQDDPELYQSILAQHARTVQTIALYKEYKNEYGTDAARKFIDSLEDDWQAEKFYIKLLAEEKAFEKILSRAREKSKLQPAIEYLRPIVDIYPNEVFEIIAGRAEAFLDDNTGRNYYRQAAEWLRLIKKVRDEKVKEKFTDFINHLLTKFSNRPALKDEFRKTGFLR